MQRKDLALRVLSTAAIMSIVTSIAAPAFAGTYYLGDFTESEFKVEVDESGNVTVNGVKDTTDVVIRGGKEADYAAPAPATGNAEGSSATAATQELEATGSADAAGESQPDPDDAFTLNETGEDSAQNQEGNNPTENPTEDTTDNPTEPPKKDVVYQYDPAADPEPEQQATKLAPTSAAPAAKTSEATLADAPAPTTSAAGSVTTPTTSVIKVINNWVGEAAKEFKIRLSNVNIKTKAQRTQWDDTAAMTVSGSGNTKIELDGNNVLDSTEANYNNDKSNGFAGLNKQGTGTLTITDEETDDGQLRTTKNENDKTGTLTAVGGIGAAGIGGNGQYRAGNNENVTSGKASVNNIVIEGYANVTAISGKGNGDQCGGAGIGGGNCQDADNIIVRGDANVMAKSTNGFGAAIGGGYLGSATNIKIYGNANVTAEASEEKRGYDYVAAIGKGYGAEKTDVTIGSEGKNREEEKTTVKVKSRRVGIGGLYGNGGGTPSDDVTTNITIQGGATVESESGSDPAIGADVGNVTIVIKDNAHITKATTRSDIDYVAIGGTGYSATQCNEKVDVSIQGNAKLDKVGWIGGKNVKEATVTVKDRAEIGDVVRIGGDNNTAKTTVNILNNAVVKKLTGMIRGSDSDTSVTIDGGADGKVKINENAPGYGAINSNNLTIGDNVLIKLRAWSDTVSSADIALREKIKNNTSAEIWYANADGTLYKIIHSEDLCKKGSTETITKQPTCTEPGSARYTCKYESTNGATNHSCDRTWTGEVPALGHDYQKTSTVLPTCVAQGYDVYTCTHDSSHTEKKNYTPALGHDFHGTETVTLEPTCAATGTKTVQCTRCTEVETQTIPKDPDAHDWGDWEVTTPATCTEKGEKTRKCRNDPSHVERQEIPATGHQQTHIEGEKKPTCTEPGYTGDEVCDACGTVVKKGTVIPALGHHWKDNGDGTHTCPDCGATEGQPVNTNSALELRVVDAEGMDQPFTVSQNGTLRTYTGAYDTATLTGDLDTLRYLQDHGAQTIQFVTNGQTSSFSINDLLAQGSGSEVFYLTHRGAEEPTLLLVEADHSELVKD